MDFGRLFFALGVGFCVVVDFGCAGGGSCVPAAAGTGRRVGDCSGCDFAGVTAGVGEILGVGSEAFDA